MPEAKEQPKEIEKEIIDLYHEQLKTQQDKLDWIMERRGITLKTIDKYLIGYDPRTHQYTIPIKDGMGNYVNIRKWQNKEPKIMSYKEGYGEGRLYPIENVMGRNKKIIFCEGEWDCLLLNQYNFNAITKTVGVSCWKDRWDEYFKGKDVIFIYDCQQISIDAAEKHKDKLMQFANTIKIVDLGLGHKEDITDWFTKHKKTKDELAALIRKSKVKDIYELIDLSESLESRYYNQKIKFNSIVVGKDLQPYIIPEEIKAKCLSGQADSSKICIRCPLAEGSKLQSFSYENEKDALVRMINQSDDGVTGIIRQHMRIPASRHCPGAWSIDVLKRQNVEEVSVIPEINHEIIDQDYVIRNCYFFGINLKLNQSYLLKGTTWADPKTQMGVHLISSVKEARDNIAKFVLTDEIKEDLKLFQPKKDNIESMKEKLKDIYNDLTYNITRMYERQNLIMAIDLVYHSILHFKFLGRSIKKGWLECCIIGDTKCGKSETAENLVRHYKAGEFITSGENTSRAGLLGGEQQTKRGSWNVTWGKLVMNNKGAITLDEADELKKKGIIGQLSGVRSSGIAELVQIQSQKAMAKTRIIWITNPLWGRMSEHNYGVETIKEIFETQQDISRIDFAVGAAGEDVSDEIINIRHKEKYDHKYTSEYCHYMVMFSWSRLESHVKFTKKAEDLILHNATKLGKEFTPDIPLVIGAEMRIKLARIAVSIAARLYSTDPTGENVVIKDTHVQIATDFVYECYDNKVMGYKDYSDQRKREKEIGDTKRLDEFLKDTEVISMFLDTNRFQLRDLEDIFHMDKKTVIDLVAYMRKERIIRRIHTFYVKTPAFIYHLKKKKEELIKRDPLDQEEPPF